MRIVIGFALLIICFLIPLVFFLKEVEELPWGKALLKAVVITFCSIIYLSLIIFSVYLLKG